MFISIWPFNILNTSQIHALSPFSTSLQIKTWKKNSYKITYTEKDKNNAPNKYKNVTSNKLKKTFLKANVKSHGTTTYAHKPTPSQEATPTASL